MYQYELNLKKDGETIAKETHSTEETLRQSIHKLEQVKETNRLVTEAINNQSLDN